VFVELEVTPLVWRLQADGGIQAHTGDDAGPVQRVLLDEQGRLYLLTPRGLGLVHSADMLLAAEAVEQGRWQPETVSSAALPAIGAFVSSPARQKKPAHA